jgi:hypothetical protein
MEIDPGTKEQLIEFARSQMARRGEIDSLIFTTKDIMAGMKNVSEYLDKTVADVVHVLHSIDEGAEKK